MVTPSEACRRSALSTSIALGLLTWSATAAEALGRKLASPAAAAERAWGPTARPPTVRLAVPPESVAEPSTAAPSRKVTVPSGVPAPGATAATLAVKVTAWPARRGATC